MLLPGLDFFPTLRLPEPIPYGFLLIVRRTTPIYNNIPRYMHTRPPPETDRLIYIIYNFFSLSVARAHTHTHTHSYVGGKVY